MTIEVLFGFLIALVVSMTGMGGGPLAVPVLTLVLGMDAAQAVGTSLLFVTVTKMVATPVYFLRRQVHMKTVLTLAAGGLPGVALGTWLLSRMNSKGLQPVILTVVGGTIVVMALASLWRLLGRAPLTPERPCKRLLAPLAFPIGLEVGFSSAGAGALGSLLLMHCTSLRMSQIVGTDLLFGLILSASGGGMHLAVGGIDTTVLWKLCAGGVAGAALGAHLGTRIPARSLRAALSSVLVLLGGQLCWKGLQVMMR